MVYPLTGSMVYGRWAPRLDSSNVYGTVYLYLISLIQEHSQKNYDASQKLRRQSLIVLYAPQTPTIVHSMWHRSDEVLRIYTIIRPRQLATPT